MPLPDPVYPPSNLPTVPLVAPPAPPVSPYTRLSAADLAPQRVQIARSAQDLREARFGEKSQVDNARLSLADEKMLLDKAKTIEAISASKAKLQQDYRKTLTSAAAIQAFSALDPSQSNFQKEFGKITAKYADGLDTKAAQSVMAQKRNDFTLLQNAEHQRTIESFNDPDVAAAYNAAAAHGDTQFANKQADAVAAMKKQAKSLAVNPDVPLDVRTSIYDPMKGTFNLDPTVLTKADMIAAQAKAARDAAAVPAAQLSAIRAALKETPEDATSQTTKDVRYNLQQAEKNASFKLMNGTAPTQAPAAAAPSAVDTELQNLLGGSSAAPTAGQQAGAPAPQPAAAIPGGDELALENEEPAADSEPDDDR